MIPAGDSGQPATPITELTIQGLQVPEFRAASDRLAVLSSEVSKVADALVGICLELEQQLGVKLLADDNTLSAATGSEGGDAPMRSST